MALPLVSRRDVSSDPDVRFGRAAGLRGVGVAAGVTTVLSGTVAAERMRSI